MKKKNQSPPGETIASENRCERLEMLHKADISSIDDYIQRFEHLFFDANEAMSINTMDGRMLDCNRKHIDLFGYSRDEIKKMKLYNFHPTETFAEIQTLSTKLLKNDIVSFEIPMCKKDGDIFPAAVTGILKKAGEDFFVQNLIFDLSEREKAHQELRANEQRYRRVVEKFFDGIIIHRYGKIIDSNRRASRILGYSRKQLCRMTVLDLHPKSDHDEVIKSIFRAEKTSHFESRWEKADGSLIDVEIYSSITDEENRTMTTMVREITERKQREAMLRDSEQKFRSIFDKSLDGIMLRTSDLKPLAFNPAFCRMHGRTEEELLNIDRKMYVDIEDNTFSKYIQILRENGHYSGEVCAIHKDGTRFPTEVASTIFTNSKDEECALIIVRDFSQRKQFEKELEAAREAAEQASRAKSEFLAHMSHEIRTPLNGVVGVLDLMLNTTLNREQMDLVQTGKRSANSLLAVINDVLDFSKIEAGQMDLEIIDFNLRDTIAEIAELPTLQSEKKGLEFIYHVRPDVPALLRGDPGRIRQIIHNLTGNAVKFTPRGEVVLRVSREKETDAHARIRFEISDTGIGIPREKLESIFEPFKQSDSSTTRQYGGTGLGLTISKRLANMMGGDIEVTSIENQGSLFHFSVLFEKQRRPEVHIQTQNDEIRGKRILLVDNNRLHLQPEDNFEGVPQSKVQPKVSENDRKTRRILIAEDNPANKKLTVKMVRQFGYSADSCTNGKEALTALEKINYHIVLMDVQMPEMDGLEATRKIRDPESKVKNRAVKIIAMTAYAMKGDKERFLGAGMDDYISKPIKPGELQTVIEKQLSK